MNDINVRIVDLPEYGGTLILTTVVVVGNEEGMTGVGRRLGILNFDPIEVL